MYHYRSKGRYKCYNSDNRYKALFILAMIALIIVVVIAFAGENGIQNNNYITQRNARLRAEAQKALNSVNSLSRLGASSSSATLGKVRQYIHGMEVLNDLNVGVYGEVGRLYTQATFDRIYSHIDEYETKLTSGGKINEVLSALSADIEQLTHATLTMVNQTITE